MSAITFSGLHIGNFPNLPAKDFDALYQGVRGNVNSPEQIAVAKLEKPNHQVLLVSTGKGAQPADVPITALMATYSRAYDGASYQYDSGNAGLPSSQLPKSLTGPLLQAVYGVLPPETVAGKQKAEVEAADAPDRHAALTSKQFQKSLKR